MVRLRSVQQKWRTSWEPLTRYTCYEFVVLCANPSGNKIVSSATVNPSLRDRCFTILRELSKAHSVLPKSCFIPSGVALSGAPCHAHGPVMDTWNGFLDGDQVCVKALHTQKVAEGLDKIKRVCDDSSFQ